MAQREHVLNDVWDVGTLTWVRMQQSVISTDTLTVSLAGVSTATNQTTGNTTLSSLLTELQGKADLTESQPVSGVGALTAASGSVAGSGNNTLITPAAGKKVRCYYLAYNNALAVEAAFRFGAAGTLFLRNNLTAAGSVISKDFGDFRYVEGAVNESLILNLSLAVTTIWNAFYVEI